MKKIHFVLSIKIMLLLFFSSQGAIGQNSNGWKDQKFKGNVKSVSKRTYKYENGKKGKWGLHNYAYLLKSVMVLDYDLEFDNAQNIVKKITYKTSIRQNDSIRHQHFYKYNSLNQIESELEIYENGPIQQIVSYEYDSKNRLIKKDENKGNKYGRGHYEYEYDSNGALEKETYFGSKGRIMRKIEYTNNELGQKVKTLRSTYNDKKRKWILTGLKEFNYNNKNQLTEWVNYLKDINDFSYNSKEQLEELITYLKNGRISDKHEYIYDEFGNVIIDKEFKNYDEVGFNIKFKYKFDSNNNWINCIVHKNHLPIYIVERKIEYKN